MSKPAYTTVLNISGGGRLYSFLPPHGVDMIKNQSITYKGDLIERLIPSWPYHLDKDRPPNRMKMTSLRKAEQDKLLQIIVTSRQPIKCTKLTKAYASRRWLSKPDPNYVKGGSALCFDS